MAKDPLKLKKYDVGNGQKSSKMIYIFLLLVPILLVISLGFYFLGHVFSSSPEDNY
jgi:flagellar basal body-associated protein FliL